MIKQLENSTSIGLLTVGRPRPGFDPQWGKQIQVEAQRMAQRLPWKVYIPSCPATDDASLRQALCEIGEAGCLGLIVIQPTMGDGRLVSTLAQLWKDPIVLWATGENPDSESVSACTLVGAHAFASLLRQLHHPFEIVNGSPSEDATLDQLKDSLRLTVISAKLRRSKVGLVGTHAPGFLNMQVDAGMIYEQLGATVHHFGVQELIDTVREADVAKVQADRKEVDSLNLKGASDTTKEALEMSCRYAVALRELTEQHHLDAIAVRCWPELPNVLGVWPYLTFARLADEGYNIAMEGDLDGAITLMLGRLLSGNVGYLSDWLAHNRSTITLWHQGEAPLSICDRNTIEIDNHFNNNKPLVINAQLAADCDITLARLWHCDGQYRLTAVNAHTAKPIQNLKGTYGLAVFDSLNVEQWFEQLCHEGMPHHLALFHGHQAQQWRRLSRQLGIKWIEPA